MEKAFKYLRITLAVILPLYLIAFFAKDAVHQFYLFRNGGLDGPLAHYTSYTFRLNDITLALFVSIFLVFDIDVQLPNWGNLVLKTIGFSCLAISAIAITYLIRQGIYRSDILLHFIKLFLFQIAYLVTSIVIIGKGFDADWHRINYKGSENA